MKHNLKECPFCDAQQDTPKFVNQDGNILSVTCCFCGATAEWGYTEAEAVKNWNTRKMADEDSTADTHTTNDCRAEFEEWAESMGWLLANTNVGGWGKVYIRGEVQTAWKAWQAAQDALRKETAIDQQADGTFICRNCNAVHKIGGKP